MLPNVWLLKVEGYVKKKKNVFLPRPKIVSKVNSPENVTS